MVGNQIDVKAHVLSLSVRYKKHPLETSFQYATVPPPQYADLPEIEPSYVNVQLSFQDKENRHYFVGMVLRKEDASHLNLMVGDNLTVRLLKDSQK